MATSLNLGVGGSGSESKTGAFPYYLFLFICNFQLQTGFWMAVPRAPHDRSPSSITSTGLLIVICSLLYMLLMLQD